MVNRLQGKRKQAKVKSNFVYRKRTQEEVKTRADQASGRFDVPFKGNFDIFRPKVGDNLIRILPPTWDDHTHFGYDVWMHGFVGPDKSSYICPAKMKNKPCPICTASREAADAGEQDEARALAVQRKVVVWIIDRDADAETPMLWLMSSNQDKEISARQHSKRTGKLFHIDHPDEGFDISIQRTGQGLKTRYVLQIERDPSQISDDSDKQEEILAFIGEHKLPDILRFYDTKHLEGVISGTVQEKDEDLDEDETDDDEAPKKKKSKKPARGDDDDEDEEEDEPVSRASRRHVKEEAEDEDESEDEDEEEDEKPAKKPAKKTKARHEDDDEEDEAEEDEDEEDEKPRHKGKHKKPARDEEEDESEEDEDDDNVDEDEEEDEKPAKKKPRTRVHAKSRHEDDDDDEEEAEDEDEEEDTPPRRRVKSTRH